MSSGYKSCICCGEIFVSNGVGDDYCHSCMVAECESYHEHGMATECQKPICGCGEYMELGVNDTFECFAGCEHD